MDPISAAFTMFGVVLAVISWIYLMFVAFEHDFAWGMFTLFLPPLAYFYALTKWSLAKSPLALAGFGLICFWIAS